MAAGRPVDSYLYIDSGADYTLLPYRLGRLLGLDPAQGEVREVRGVNGAVGVIYVTLSMEIAGMPPLLGRADVFDRFEIRFRQSRGEVVFEPI